MRRCLVPSATLEQKTKSHTGFVLFRVFQLTSLSPFWALSLFLCVSLRSVPTLTFQLNQFADDATQRHSIAMFWQTTEENRVKRQLCEKSTTNLLFWWSLSTELFQPSSLYVVRIKKLLFQWLFHYEHSDELIRNSRKMLGNNTNIIIWHLFGFFF